MVPIRRKPLRVSQPEEPVSLSKYSDLPEVVSLETQQHLAPSPAEAGAPHTHSSVISNFSKVACISGDEPSTQCQDIMQHTPPAEANNTSTKNSTTFDSFEEHSLPSESLRVLGEAILYDSKIPQTTHRPGTDIAQGDIPHIDRPDAEGFSPLTRAASNGQAELVRTLLVNGANIKARHAINGRTALDEAALKGHLGIIDLLVQHGGSFDSLDSDSGSFLHLAAARGDLSLMRSLLDRGAPIDIKGPQDQTLLHVAVRHPDIVMLLIRRQADVHARNAAQQTPLHVSAAGGIAQTCDILINLHGAQLDARDINSKTPLHIAVEAEHIDITKLLLSRMNLKAKDATLQIVLFSAIETGNTRLVELLFECGASLKGLGDNAYKPATLTAKSGNLAMLDLIIKKKCRLKEKNKDEWSPLHVAAQHGHALMIGRLLENGLSFKATTKTKDTPLILAVKGGHFAATDVLLRGKGESQVKSEDNKEEQPLHHAARNGDVAIFKLLLSHKADINAQNALGWRPIHLAIAYGHSDIVELLLIWKVSVEEKLGKPSVNKKETHQMVINGQWAEARWPYPESRPLHLAIEYGRGDIALLLLSKGAKTEACCSENWRPLHHAAFSGNIEMTEQLLERNANVHAVTSEGKTALQLAQLRSTAGVLPSYGADYSRVQETLSKVEATVRKQTKDQWKSLVAFNGKKAQEKHDAIKVAAMAADEKSR